MNYTKINKNIVNTIIIIFIFITISSSSSAKEIETGSDEIRLENILIGGYREFIIPITTDNEEGFTLTPYIKGSIKDWITFFQEEEIEVSRNSPLSLKIIIKPKTAEPGLYSSKILLKFTKKVPTLIKNKERREIDLIITTTKKEISEIKIENVDVYDAEKGSLIDIAVNGTNKGNIPQDITINIHRKDKLIPSVITLSPFENAEKIINIPTDEMDIGRNDLKIDIVSSGKILFSKNYSIKIKEKGTLSKDIKMITIAGSEVSYKGEEIELRSIFENIGESSVYALSRGEITKDDELIQTFESNIIYSPRGRVRNTEISFIPETKGDYVIYSSIHYGNKKTDDLEFILHVLPKSRKIQPLKFTLYPLLIISVILVIIIFIKRTKKK